MVKNCISRLGFLVLERWSHTHWIHVDWSKIYLHLWKSTIHVGKQTSHMYPMMGIHIWSWQVGSSNPRRPVARILGFPNSVTRTTDSFRPYARSNTKIFASLYQRFFCWEQELSSWTFELVQVAGIVSQKKQDSSRRTQDPPTPTPEWWWKGVFGKGWSWPNRQDEKSTACSQLWNRLKLKLKKVWWFWTHREFSWVRPGCWDTFIRGLGRFGGDLPNMVGGRSTMNWIMLLNGFSASYCWECVLFMQGLRKIWRDLVCNLYGGYPKNRGTGKDHWVNPPVKCTVYHEHLGPLQAMFLVFFPIVLEFAPL